MPSFACLKNLGSFRQFYLTYPRISQTLSGKLSITPQRLIERPTFSHFLELFKVEDPLTRNFQLDRGIRRKIRAFFLHKKVCP